MEGNDPNILSLIELRTKLEKEKEIFLFDLYHNYTQEAPFSKFQQIAINVEKVIADIDQILKAECKHEYEEDWIDVDPERSKKITYCTICHCTFSSGRKDI